MEGKQWDIWEPPTHIFNPYAAGGLFDQHEMMTKSWDMTEMTGIHLTVLSESFQMNTNMT